MPQLRVRPFLIALRPSDYIVASELEALKFEQLLAVPIAPAGEHGGLRYGVTATAQPGAMCVYVRSYSLEFDLVREQWLKAWRRQRFFSLGSGLADGVEIPSLLLVQAFDQEAELDVLHAAITGVLRGRARTTDARIGLAHRRMCLRLAAALDTSA